MLLSIDLLGEELVKVDCTLARRSLCTHLLDVEVILQILVEPHNHVKAVTIHHLEHKHVGSIGLITDGNSAAENALVLQMGLVDEALDFEALVIRRNVGAWLVVLCEDFDRRGFGSVCLIEQQLKLVFVVLEAANQVQVL